MPNLVGVHEPGARPDELGEALARMMRAADYPGFDYVRVRAASAGLAVGNILTGVEQNTAQPARDEARGLWLMLDGEVLNSTELARQLTREGHRLLGEDDAEVALSAYLAYGSGFQERLNGQWNLVLAAEDRAWLFTDRLGSRLLYAATDGGRLVFASEAKAVIAGRKVATRPGGLGLYQLLSAGSPVGGHTWLEGVEVLPPGTTFELAPGGRRRHRWKKLLFNEGGPEMSEAGYAEGFARLLRLATERTMRHHPGDPVAITLSGGLDSRAVGLAIDRRHLPIDSLTYGAEQSPDAIYAAQLAQVIGFRHHHIEGLYPGLVEESARVGEALLGPPLTGRRGFYSAQLERAVWRSEAMSALTGVASTIWHPLYARHMRVMLNGACGDAMTGSHLPPALLLGPTRAALIQDLSRRTLWQDPALLAAVLAPGFAAQARAELPAYFAGTFAEIDADDPLAIANIWDMENRQRRGTFSSFPIERYFCTCRSPFLDDELVSFLCRVPGRWRFQQRIYKRMLVSHFPEARHVPWAYTRGRITQSPSYEFLRESVNFVKGRVQRLLPAGRGAMEHWLFRDEVKMLREDRELWVGLERFLGSDLFPDGVLAREGVRAFAQGFLAGQGSDPRAADQATLYAHLVGIARATELFVAHPGEGPPPAAHPGRYGVVPRRVRAAA